ncbi:MAG: hypothetical protein LBM76_01020 [Mycoplasmataceae bacterium]|jgi:hypothetical protein|nr:hypothetical protein [Mycoplasmataceae bacterium]
MKKKTYGNLWKKESKIYRHNEDVEKHQKLLRHALIKYTREKGKKIKTNDLVDWLLEMYTTNRII